MRVTVLAVVTCLALMGCSGEGATERAEPSVVETGEHVTSTESTASVATEPSTAPPLPPRRRTRPVTVPDLTAVELRSAREWLTGDGLTVRADVVRDCRLLQGIVAAQEPRPGTRLPRGSEVTLTFGRRPATADCARTPAPQARRAFLGWATGRGAAPAFAPHVRLLQGNRQVARLTAAVARDRTSWRLPAGYAELAALDLLAWLDSMDNQHLLQPSRGLSAYCLQRVAPLPPDLVDRLGWSAALITSSADACLEVAAVQVWVDDAGRISAVGFLSGSP